MKKLCAFTVAAFLFSGPGFAQAPAKTAPAKTAPAKTAPAKTAPVKKGILTKTAVKKKEAPPKAETKPQANPKVAQKEGTFQVVEAQICSGVHNKQPADNKKTYSTGEKAYIWLKLRPKSDSANVRLRWSLNDKPYWTMDAKPVQLGRIWYNKTLFDPGDWKVEVLDDNDTVLHSETLTASGASTSLKSAQKAKAPIRGAVAPAASAEQEGSHFAVIDLKLAEEIKDREPVNPKNSFAQGTKIYTWVKLKVKDPETGVKFKWYLDDKPVGTSKIVTVKQSPSWRTWLHRTADKPGNWKVEVVDSDDNAVHSEQFSIQ